MKRNSIRLTESQLRRIIMESINEYARYDSVKQAYGEQGDRPYDLHLKRVCGWNGDNGYEKNDYFKDHGRTPEESQKMHDRKSRNKQNLDPLRLKQAKMANSQLQEVSLKGKSGKTMTDTMPIAQDIADNMKESKLHKNIKESVKKVLRENTGENYSDEYPFYVAADINSDYFQTFDEAYQYALNLAKNEQDWYEDIDVMDNVNWETLVRFTEDGIHDFTNSTFTQTYGY